MNVLVIGKAKTGTTIIAQTIQRSMRRADLVMEPKSPKDLFSRHRPKARNTVIKVIFEHWNQTPRSRNALVHGELIQFDKVIYTLRDPRDEWISRLIYFVFPWSVRNPGNSEKIEEWVKLIQQKEREPSSISFLELLARQNEIFGGKFINQLRTISGYGNFLNNRSGSAYLLRYEDFVQHDLDGLQAYLGMTLEAAEANSPHHYTRRTASLNNWKSFMLPQDIEYLKSNFGALMQEFGYTDWQLEPVSSLPPEHHSRYIRQLLTRGKRESLVGRVVKYMRMAS